MRPLDSSASTSFSNRERVRVREPVSFWRENKIAVVILLRVCEIGETCPPNVGDPVQLESRKGLAIIIKTTAWSLSLTKSKNISYLFAIRSRTRTI